MEAIKDKNVIDDVWLSQFRFCNHEGKLYRNLIQPSRDFILNRNSEMRKTKGIINDLSFGRFQLRIPLADYEMLKKKYPILKNGSNAERNKFYKKFILSSESLPYRVQG